MKKYGWNTSTIVFLLFVLLAFPVGVFAKDTYPKLANYYLNFFRQGDYEQLAKWDLLVIQAEMTAYNPAFFEYYRRANPEGKVVPYIYPAFFYEEASSANYAGLPLRKYVLDEVNSRNWWLKSGNGGSVYGWPRLRAINVTNPDWQDFNVSYLTNKLGMSSWDGIMYDMVDAEIGHYSQNGIDINNDGSADSIGLVNQKWREGMAQLFSKTRRALGDGKLIITNGNSVDMYQPNINGRIFENFPTPWEGNGSWQATMYQYLRRLPGLNKTPATYIINATTNNTGRMNDYRKLRFGLASALLGDGYFSFDFGDQSHQQLWWYDEYDVKLGRAETSYFNLLDPNDDYVKAGLWRRDFENGVAIVNSTSREQLYIFKHEEFEKIKGAQDPGINNGAKINYIRLAPNDGVILRTVKNDIRGQSFVNGDFMRVFNSKGVQPRGGFFAYKAEATAGSRVLIDDLDSNNSFERMVERAGKITISGAGRKTTTIVPFGVAFKGKLSFGAYDFNNDGFKEIVVAPLSGGGPQILIYSQNGKLISKGFFAFDKNFRGGVHIAVGDIDQDGKGEIMVTPASGLAPTVKIFSEQGKALGSFLAYDKNFKGGVNVSFGDIDGDGKKEIITGPNAGGPHVRIFSVAGQLLSQFMAFDASGRTGVRVSVSDIDGDGKAEILAGTANF